MQVETESMQKAPPKGKENVQETPLRGIKNMQNVSLYNTESHQSLYSEKILTQKPKKIGKNLIIKLRHNNSKEVILS